MKLTRKEKDLISELLEVRINDLNDDREHYEELVKDYHYKRDELELRIALENIEIANSLIDKINKG